MAIALNPPKQPVLDGATLAFLRGTAGPIQPATIPPPPPVTPTIAFPNVGGGTVPILPPTPPVTFDPLLSTDAILTQGREALDLARAPLDVEKFIVPGSRELLAESINEQLNINRAAAQSTFGARGLTGSSTEVQTLTRDLPAAANKALAEGHVKLLQAALPLALQEKQIIVDSVFKSASLTTELRNLIGDEKFKQLSLDQQRELANQDVKLKLTLAEVEMKFQAAMKQVEFEFTAAENEKDRRAASEKFEFLKAERKKSRFSAFTRALTTLAGIGIGAGFAASGAGGLTALQGGILGGVVGQSAGGLSQLFLMD